MLWMFSLHQLDCDEMIEHKIKEIYCNYDKEDFQSYTSLASTLFCQLHLRYKTLKHNVTE